MKYQKLKNILIFILGMVTFAVGSFIITTFVFVRRPTPPDIVDDYEQICFWSDVNGINAAVSPKGCYSTTCTRQMYQAGTAMIDTQAYKIQLETQFKLVATSRFLLPCIENCAGGGRVQFDLGHLIPNRYDVWFRDRKVGVLDVFSGLPTPHQCFENMSD
jgi:hypothetical protein